MAWHGHASHLKWLSGFKRCCISSAVEWSGSKEDGDVRSER